VSVQAREAVPARRLAAGNHALREFAAMKFVAKYAIVYLFAILIRGAFAETNAFKYWAWILAIVLCLEAREWAMKPRKEE
jgi:hypothetical protein